MPVLSPCPLKGLSTAASQTERECFCGRTYLPSARATSPPDTLLSPTGTSEAAKRKALPSQNLRFQGASPKIQTKIKLELCYDICDFKTTLTLEEIFYRPVKINFRNKLQNKVKMQFVQSAFM
jgi:hypothetical protein